MKSSLFVQTCVASVYLTYNECSLLRGWWNIFLSFRVYIYVYSLIHLYIIELCNCSLVNTAQPLRPSFEQNHHSVNEDPYNEDFSRSNVSFCSCQTFVIGSVPFYNFILIHIFVLVHLEEGRICTQNIY